MVYNDFQALHCISVAYVWTEETNYPISKHYSITLSALYIYLLKSESHLCWKHRVEGATVFSLTEMEQLWFFSQYSSTTYTKLPTAKWVMTLF